MGTMHRALLCIVCLGLFAVLTLAQDAPPGDDEGFVSIFTGQDLAGWVVAGTAETWKVEDGTLICTGQGGGWIHTEKVYRDLILRVEYKVGPKGNSGIFVHAAPTGHQSAIAMECQVQDDFGRQPSKGTAGAFYNVKAPAKNMSKPAGEWNQVEILWQGDRVRTIMNGEVLYDLDLMDEELNNSVTAADVEKPRDRLREGFIGFQKHTGTVAFRNIRVQELSPPAGEAGEGAP
jgi:hypothetical protein